MSRQAAYPGEALSTEVGVDSVETTIGGGMGLGVLNIVNLDSTGWCTKDGCGKYGIILVSHL